MRKFLFSLVCMILSVVSANATTYNFQLAEGKEYVVVTYYKGGNPLTTDSSTTSFATDGEYFYITPNDGYIIESIQLNPGGAGYVNLTVENPTGENWVRLKGEYDSSTSTYIGAWKSRNQLKIATKSIAESRDKSFTVTADNFEDFTLMRSDNSVVELSADNNVVAFSEAEDSKFTVQANNDKELVSVSLNGTALSYTGNQCIIESSKLDGAALDVRTVWPDEEYTLTFNMGSTNSECFSSITVDGVETAFTDLKSSYPAGTKLSLSANPVYKFTTFSVNPDPSSQYSASGSQWDITMKANTTISVAATRQDTYKITVKLNGPDGSIKVNTDGKTTVLKGNGETTTLYVTKKTSETTSFYFTNGDSNKYEIKSYILDGVEQTPEQENENTIQPTADVSIELTVEEKVLGGKITFQFDDYTLVTLTDLDGTVYELTGNEYIYPIDAGDYKTFKITPKDSSNENFEVTKNGNKLTTIYGGVAWLYVLTDGDIIKVKSKASDVKYTLSVNIDSSMSFSDLFSYVTIGNETITSADGFASEYAEETKCDFCFKDAIEVSSFTVNGESLSPTYGFYRFFLNANTTVNITAGAKQEDWTLYVSVLEPDYVGLYDMANGHTKIALVKGQNNISTSNGHTYSIEWTYNDGSKMNSILLDDTDLTPSNEHQNNVSFSVTADGQHLYINNTAPVAKNDVLRVSVAGTACSSNITITDKDGSEIATIRPNGAEVEATDYNFSYSTQAPLKVTFYGFAPLTLTCNDQSISKTKYEPEVAEGEIGNTTAQFIYTLDNLAEGTNVVAIDASEDTSSVRSIRIDSENSDVYNLQGMRIRTNANDEQIRELPAGIYIINGKKVIKK